MPLRRSKSAYGRGVCHRLHTRLPDAVPAGRQGQGYHGLIAEGNNLCNSCNLWLKWVTISKVYFFTIT